MPSKVALSIHFAATKQESEAWGLCILRPEDISQVAGSTFKSCIRASASRVPYLDDEENQGKDGGSCCGVFSPERPPSTEIGM